MRFRQMISVTVIFVPDWAFDKDLWALVTETSPYLYFDLGRQSARS